MSILYQRYKPCKEDISWFKDSLVQKNDQILSYKLGFFFKEFIVNTFVAKLLVVHLSLI